MSYKISAKKMIGYANKRDIVSMFASSKEKRFNFKLNRRSGSSAG